jgi:phage terminase small subunit
VNALATEVRKHPSRVRFERRAEIFVAEYLKDLNGTAAVRRMGFSGDAKQAAHAFLRDGYTQELLAAELGQMIRRRRIDAESVLEEIAAIGFCDPREYFDEFGNLRAMHELSRAAAGAIASIEVGEEIDESEDGRKTTATRVTKIKFWNKVEALDKLGRYLKLWESATAKVNVNVDARSVNVHNHASSPTALRAVDGLIARALSIGAPPEAAPAGSDGPVLPAAIPAEPGGHGTPVDDRADPRGAA